MTLVTRFSTPFVGADVDRLPRLPAFGLGVDDYAQRWTASSAPTTPTSWMSVSANPVALAATATPPVKTTDAWGTYLDFSAGNGAMLNSTLTYRTIGLLVSATNNDEVAPMVGTLEAGSISRQVNAVAFAAVGGTVSLPNNMNGDLWHAIFVTVDGDEANLHIDGTRANNGSATQALITGLRLAHNWAQSVYGKIRVMEVLTYDRAITQAETATIRDAWRNGYPGIALP